MALQMSGVDATTQQGPAQNDGYEPYGTMEVVPTLYRPTSSVAPQECPTILQVLWHRRSAPQFYKFCGTAGVSHNSTSSVAPQECPTILQVMWHRRNAPQFYKFCGTAGAPQQFYKFCGTTEERGQQGRQRKKGASRGTTEAEGH